MNEEEFGRVPIRMEEEEEDATPRRKRGIGFAYTDDDEEDEIRGPAAREFREAYGDLVRALAEERKAILDDDRLSPKDKQILLDESRKTFVVANGGSVRKSDSVVYGILVFGAVVLIALALLNVFGGLDTEITVAFVGTVLGGTIATIAQKLGKL